MILIILKHDRRKIEKLTRVGRLSKNNFPPPSNANILMTIIKISQFLPERRTLDGSLCLYQRITSAFVIFVLYLFVYFLALKSI